MFKLLKVIIGIIVFLMTINGAMATVSNADLEHCYSLENTSGIDFTGNADLNVLTATVSNVTTGCPNGNCISVNGAGFLKSTNDVSSNLLGSTNMTMAVWLKRAAGLPNLAGAIGFGEGDGGNPDNWYIVFGDGTNKPASYTGGSQVDANTALGTVWEHVAITYNAVNESTTIFLNGAIDKMGALTLNILTDVIRMGILWTEGTHQYNGQIDEAMIFSRVLTDAEILELATINTSCSELTSPAPPSINYTIINITALDKFDSSTINSSILNGTITNGSLSFFTSGTNPLSWNMSNLTTLSTNPQNWTITINALDHYSINTTVEIRNASPDINQNALLSPIIKIYNTTYSNYISYSGTNYTRNLTYTLKYVCPTQENNIISLYTNNSYRQKFSLTCNNDTIQSLTRSYKNNKEGINLSIYFYLNSTYKTQSKNTFFGNSSFTWDLFNPTIFLNMSVDVGFINFTTDINMSCSDSITPLLTYNKTFNNNAFFYGNLSNNTMQSNSTIFINGNNTLNGICSDFFGTTDNNITLNVYAKTFALIDEKENIDFDVNNLSSVLIYFDDNSTFIDLKSINSTKINFTSIDNEKIRVELGYSDGTIITRYIDITLIDDQEIRICANKEGITHFEQLIIAATEREAILKNIFSNCYIAADFTRFAYQDSLILKAFTIQSSYSLYTVSDENRVFLANVDGSISSFINIDILEFTKTAYNFNIFGDAFSFENLDNQTVKIRYINQNNDNDIMDLTIDNLDNGDIYFTEDDFTDPNNFIIYFDYSSLNVNTTTIFRISAEITKDSGTVDSKKSYFNILGQSGFIKAEFAIAITFFMAIFGFTMAIARIVFSWFGIMIMIFNLAFLSFAIATWYVLFFQVIYVLALIFIIFTLVTKNSATVA